MLVTKSNYRKQTQLAAAIILGLGIGNAAQADLYQVTVNGTMDSVVDQITSSCTLRDALAAYSMLSTNPQPTLTVNGCKVTSTPDPEKKMMVKFAPSISNKPIELVNVIQVKDVTYDLTITAEPGQVGRISAYQYKGRLYSTGIYFYQPAKPTAKPPVVTFDRVSFENVSNDAEAVISTDWDIRLNIQNSYFINLYGERSLIEVNQDVTTPAGSAPLPHKFEKNLFWNIDLDSGAVINMRNALGVEFTNNDFINVGRKREDAIAGYIDPSHIINFECDSALQNSGPAWWYDSLPFHIDGMKIHDDPKTPRNTHTMLNIFADKGCTRGQSDLDPAIDVKVTNLSLLSSSQWSPQPQYVGQKTGAVLTLENTSVKPVHADVTRSTFDGVSLDHVKHSSLPFPYLPLHHGAIEAISNKGPIKLNVSNSTFSNISVNRYALDSWEGMGAIYATGGDNVKVSLLHNTFVQPYLFTNPSPSTYDYSIAAILSEGSPTFNLKGNLFLMASQGVQPYKNQNCISKAGTPVYISNGANIANDESCKLAGYDDWQSVFSAGVVAGPYSASVQTVTGWPITHTYYVPVQGPVSAIDRNTGCVDPYNGIPPLNTLDIDQLGNIRHTNEDTSCDAGAIEFGSLVMPK